jgi:hypothetical protein
MLAIEALGLYAPVQGGSRMATTLADVKNRERDAILGEYLFPEGNLEIQVPPYVALPDIGSLTSTPRALRAKHPLVIEPFPGPGTQHGFVQRCPSLGYAFLWLPPGDDDYRNTYAAFLKRWHGIDAMPVGYDVDHLFSRSRASAVGLLWVRMVLLGPGENRSHGAGYEAARGRNALGSGGRQRGIDEIVLMKLCGVRSPRRNRPLSAEMLAHITRIAALFGLAPMEIEQGIRNLMRVAHRD